MFWISLFAIYFVSGFLPSLYSLKCDKTVTVTKTEMRYIPQTRRVPYFTYWGSTKYRLQTVTVPELYYYDTTETVTGCCEGYIPDGEDCIPDCDHDCPLFGKCIAPHECGCENGYEMERSAFHEECKPTCRGLCPANSTCTHPETCTCKPGFKMVNEKDIVVHCAPICVQDCSEKGHCVEPGRCECFSGYKMQTTNPNEPLCQPICDLNCNNGFCFAPGVCVCNVGYLMGPNTTCTPNCSHSCENGDCVEPEICACYTGYKFKYNSINVCEPICEPNCVNGDCIGPNFCICWEGYIPSCYPNVENCMKCISNNTISTFDPYNYITTAAMEPSVEDYMITILETSSEPIYPAENCVKSCNCWLKDDWTNPKSSNQQIDCQKLCIHDWEEGCFNVSSCLCDTNQEHLVCYTADNTALNFSCFTEHLSNIKMSESSTYKHSWQFWGIVVGITSATAILVGFGIWKIKKPQQQLHMDVAEYHRSSSEGIAG